MDQATGGFPPQGTRRGYFARCAARMRAAGCALAVLVVLIAGFLPGVARADIYTITGVAISATAETAIAAKQAAIAEGQFKAYSALVKRLTRPGEAEALPKIDSTMLQQVVIGFSLDNERTGPQQYLADLTVRFHPDAVELLFAQHGVEIAVTQAPPTLLVPVYRSDGSINVFEGGSPWRETLRRLGLDGRMVPMLLPLGDSTDAQIDRDALIAADRDALSALMIRYDVEFAIVAAATYDRDRAVLAGSIDGIAPSGPVRIERQVDVVPGEDEAALKGLATALLDALDEEWRSASASGLTDTGGASEKFAFVVPFQVLQDWVIIRERLEALAGVEKLDVQTLAPGSASVVVHYAGDLDGFLTGLDGIGFAMFDTGQRWELGLR